MLRLQYKIIVSLRIKLFDERAALSPCGNARSRHENRSAIARNYRSHRSRELLPLWLASSNLAMLPARAGMKRANCFASGKSRSLITSTMISAISDLSGALPCRSGFLRRKDLSAPRNCLSLLAERSDWCAILSSNQ